MTKEITKAYILQEMQDKFKLRELEPSVFAFLETVIPVYNIETHLTHLVTSFKAVSITSTGARVFFTVPDTERWTFNRYDVVFMGAGAYTVAGVYLKRIGQSSVYMDLSAAQSASYHVSLPVPIVANAGDEISVNIDGYTSTQYLRLYLDYSMEEIR